MHETMGLSGHHIRFVDFEQAINPWGLASYGSQLIS